MSALRNSYSYEGPRDARVYPRDRPNSVRSKRPRRYYLALDTPDGGQLGFRDLEIWSDCIRALRLAYPLTAWSLHPGPSEHVWEIRTLGLSADIYALIERAVGDRAAFLLFDPIGQRLYLRNWPEDDVPAFQVALENWDRDHG